MSKPKLEYFTPSEFGVWWPLMSTDLLKRLDLFRELMGSKVIISPVNGALGRHGGDSTSQHNVDMWGEVRAVDVFPTIDGKFITTEAQRQIVYENARKAGFSGIGLYTDTQPGNMLHVDVRESNTRHNPALWARVEHSYVSIGEVVANA